MQQPYVFNYDFQFICVLMKKYVTNIIIEFAWVLDVITFTVRRNGTFV